MRIRARPTFFLVLVVVLLVLALAAPRLERLDDEDAELARARLIGSAQIKNGSLLLRDFKRGQLESRFATNRTVQKVNKLQAGLAHKVSALEHKVVGLDGKVLGLDHKVVALEHKVVGLDGKVVALEHKFTGLDGDLSALVSKVEGLEDKFAPLVDIADLTDAVAAVAGKVEGLQSDQTSLSNDVGTLSGKVAELAEDAASYLNVEAARDMFVQGAGIVTTSFRSVESGSSAEVAKVPGLVTVAAASDQETGTKLTLASLGPSLHYTVQSAGANGVGQESGVVTGESGETVSVGAGLVTVQAFSAGEEPLVATVTLNLVPGHGGLQVAGQTLAGAASAR